MVTEQMGYPEANDSRIRWQDFCGQKAG